MLGMEVVVERIDITDDVIDPDEWPDFPLPASELILTN